MICRLCTKVSDKVYHFFDTEGLEMQILSIVVKHFCFEPKPEDNSSHLICNSCWITTKNFHELYLLVEENEKKCTNNFQLIKDDPYDNLSDCKDKDDTKEISNINDFNQMVQDEITNGMIKEQNSFDEETKLELNEYFEKEEETITDNIILVEKKPEFIKKKRGRPPKTQKLRKITQITRETSNNENDSDDNYKFNKSNKETTKEKKQRNIFLDQMPEETSELNTKITGTKNMSKITSKNSFGIVNENVSDNDYELDKCVKGSKKQKKEQKKKFLKRTPEETAEFNRIVAEGDALIAKVMKIFCNFCSKEQENFTSFKRHCTSVHGGQRGVVMCCEKKFYRKSKLVEHVERHVEPDKYKCGICDFIVKRKSLLKLHIINKHVEHEKPYKCSYCDKTFRFDALRIHHELVHMPEEEKKFKCSQCSKNFSTEQKLKKHTQSVHYRHYAGVCDICGKTYNNRGDLKQHRLKVHEGVELKFKCKYCDKEFSSRFTFNMHKFEEHENTNPNRNYKCPMCDKTSKTQNAIKSHIRFVHKAKAKFKCTLCNKVFKRELGLKEHMATHTGQKLYSCLQCPRTFTHSSNMIKHLKLKHPVEFEQTRQNKNKKETWIEKTSLNLLIK